MIVPSIINLFVAPMAVGTARSKAKQRGVSDFFYEGIAIYCADEHTDLMKKAVDQVASFFGDDWQRYKKNLKRIILDPDLHTTLWFGQRSLIIQESDTNRMASANHMAAWLVADVQRIQFLKERHSLKIMFSSKLMHAANESGKAKLQHFVDQKTR